MTNQFDNLKDFMKQTKGKRSFVPIKLAAEELGFQQATIKNHVANDKLEGLTIGTTMFVFADSIMAVFDKKKSQVVFVSKYLVEALERGDASVSYADIMNPIGLSTGNPHDRDRIGKILAKVSKKSLKKHGFLISVIVHLKNTKMPSVGFFKLASHLAEYEKIKFSAKTDEERKKFVKKQTKKALKYYNDI